MKCEGCGHDKQSVPFTTSNLDTDITRMRRCKECGKTWPTIEITTVEYERLRSKQLKK